MKTFVRGAAALTGSALALTLGLVGSTAQGASIPKPTGADPSPVATGAAYLATQPGVDNLVSSPFASPDYGLTIDIGWALDAAGAQPAKLAAMTSALQAHISDYDNSSGQRAKLAAYLTSQGRTGVAVDGLVDALEADIAITPPDTGRLIGGSTFTQTYAAAALRAAGSDQAEEATAFLLKQQCAAGFFRFSFAAAGDVEQTCDAGADQTPDIDTTALAVITLQNQKTDPSVATAIGKAVTWLATQQTADGSFIGYDSLFNPGKSANTTGLAGWAMGLAGRADLAAKAAGWLRGHQLANAGTCARYAAKDSGAVVVDDLSVTNAAAGPNDADATDSANRATSQALPALLWAPGGAAAGETKLTGPTDFVPAGSAQTVTISGAPGDTICASAGGVGTRVTLPASGTATYAVTLPAATGNVTVSTVDAGAEADSLTVKGLAAAKLKAGAPKKVELGEKFTVKVKGLQPGETVVVKYLGKKKTVTANAKGVLRIKLKATKLGTSKVKFTGEFGNRKGKATVKVVK